MGLSFSSVSFSCVDCGSRLNTVEELEASWKLQSKDLRILQDDPEFKDEFTVFRTQAKNQLSEDEPASCLDNRISFQSLGANETIPTSPERRTRNHTLRTCTLAPVCRNCEDDFSEVSTPTVAFRTFKHRTYSRNFSKLSVNLVDAVRKCSNN
jgi:hypothetical protein